MSSQISFYKPPFPMLQDLWITMLLKGNDNNMAMHSFSRATSSRHQQDHDEFKCTVCMEFFDDPVRTSCNHIFCKNCLDGALQNNLSCPFCRNSMSANEYIQANDVVSKMKNRTLDCADCGQKFKPIDGRQHEMECSPSPLEASAGGSLGITVNRHVFPCAYCGSKNFSRESLLAHCNANHKQAQNHNLVCTICIAFPWGNQGQASGHLLDHLNLRHKFDYDRFVDLHEDEDSSLRDALQQSLYEI